MYAIRSYYEMGLGFGAGEIFEKADRIFAVRCVAHYAGARDVDMGPEALLIGKHEPYLLGHIPVALLL